MIAWLRFKIAEQIEYDEAGHQAEHEEHPVEMERILGIA